MTDPRHIARRVAVLVDADAVGADAMDEVMAAAESEGTIVIVRAWRHWDEGQRKSWSAATKKHRISEGRQAPGRNATDIALAIDAIDLLHERAIDTFCIVTNDRDYEPLAARLRRGGRRAVLMTLNQEVFSAARSVWDHRVKLPKPNGAKASVAVALMDEDEASRIETFRQAHASVKHRDDPWVRWTDLASAANAASGKKSCLDWIKQRTGSFEVLKRKFRGEGTTVDCVRVLD